MLAVKPENQRDRGFVTVPTGSIFELLDDPREPGLYRLKLATAALLAFARDIRERTNRLEEPAEPIEVERMECPTCLP